MLTNIKEIIYLFHNCHLKYVRAFKSQLGLDGQESKYKIMT